MNNHLIRDFLNATTKAPIIALIAWFAAAGNATAQCSILADAVEGISYTYVLSDGTNASGVAYHPGFNVYYAVIAGNAIFPMETFDETGTSLYQTNAGFDYRGLWWNPNTAQLEGNGYNGYGLWASDLDASGYALNTGTTLFAGTFQPDVQSCGDYDYDADEVIYYYSGSIYRYDRADMTLLGSYELTGAPVSSANFNITSVVYTGCCGNEIGLEDYVNKTILLFNKATGEYSGSSQLPLSAVTNYNFRFSYANGQVWLYDVNTRTWTSYFILDGSSAAVVNLGNDTTICLGSSLTLNAGSSGQEYEWSTGSTDSIITIDTGGVYWVNVTVGLCVYNDTIVITDSLCSPPVAFAVSDTTVCEKFCVDFLDLSSNEPSDWQWYFEGASPDNSTEQNPEDICYNDPGTYDVTLITSGVTGNDTITLYDFITVNATPPIPVITQNGYVLTSSAAATYQWQLNLIDIPGATDQSYTVMQTGLYTVIVTNEAACVNSASLYVQIVGIDPLLAGSGFIIYPNPNSGSFMIEPTGEHVMNEVQIDIENALGQTVYSSGAGITTEYGRRSIRMEQAASGNYVVNIRANGKLHRMKLLINP
jgi:PKD repeat protein